MGVVGELAICMVERVLLAVVSSFLFLIINPGSLEGGGRRKTVGNEDDANKLMITSTQSKYSNNSDQFLSFFESGQDSSMCLKNLVGKLLQ